MYTIAVIEKIISGGQTGADRAALDGAIVRADPPWFGCGLGTAGGEWLNAGLRGVLMPTRHAVTGLALHSVGSSTFPF